MIRHIILLGYVVQHQLARYPVIDWLFKDSIVAVVVLLTLSLSADVPFLNFGGILSIVDMVCLN